LSAEFDSGAVLEIRDFPVGPGREHDVGELISVDQSAQSTDRVLELLAGRDWRLSNLSGVDLYVFLTEHANDIARGKVPRGQLVRVEPNPHAVVLAAENEAVADTVDASQRVEQVNRRVVAHIKPVEVRLARCWIVFRIQAHNQQDIWRPLLDRNS